jgi:transcriptional regulator with PAS, ATPase and Fis domain
VLASHEPLEARLAKRRAPDIEAALLAALLGRRDDAERNLLRVRGELPHVPERALSMAWAFVLVEVGEAARAAGHAHSAAEESQGADPADLDVARLLLAQAIAGQGRFDRAREVARRVLDGVGPGSADPALRAYAAIAVASLALDVGDVNDARDALEVAARARPTGLLRARTDALKARASVAGGHDPVEAREHLDRAIHGFEALGARRDLGLALLFRATAQLDSRPGAAVASAQRALTASGGAADLDRVRASSRHLAWSLPQVIAPSEAIPARIEQQRIRAQAAISQVCGAYDPSGRGADQPCADFETIDDMAALVAHAEQKPLVPLARCLVDRARVGQLLDAAQKLGAVGDPRLLAAAIPRIALSICSGMSAHLIRASPAGQLDILASYGPSPQLPGLQLSREVGAALGFFCRVDAPEAEERGFVAIPLREAGPELALCVFGAPALARADVERLMVFASLAASSLARARAAAELRERAARDAATLDAIADGLLTIAEDGVVRSANHAAARAVGVRREDLVGRRLCEWPALAPLSLMLDRAQRQLVHVLELGKGEFVVHAYGYEGGTVISIRETSMERRIARSLAGTVPRFSFDDLIGTDPAFTAALSDARRAAVTDLPILITGESGTGKELLAQAIHNASPRAGAPFIAINVTAIPRELLESELFGYEGGAFTGARSGGQAGKFEVAGRGTIVLDEIGDMPMEMQGKLLRVLQERTVQRLGGSKDILVRARVIATTHRDLETLVREGRFRLDLFHRLRVLHLSLPPLRARPGDIHRIAEDHLAKHRARTGMHVRLAPAVMEAFEAYSWPGNVRELVNLLEGKLSLLPPGTTEIREVPPGMTGQSIMPCAGEVVVPLDELERRGCELALRHFAGNVSRAAKALGISRATLYAKMKRYGIVPPEPPAAGPEARRGADASATGSTGSGRN